MGILSALGLQRKFHLMYWMSYFVGRSSAMTGISRVVFSW